MRFESVAPPRLGCCGLMPNILRLYQNLYLPRVLAIVLSVTSLLVCRGFAQAQFDQAGEQQLVRPLIRTNKINNLNDNRLGAWDENRGHCNGFVNGLAVVWGNATKLVWLGHPLQTRPDLVRGLLARRPPGPEVVALDQYSRREADLHNQVRWTP